MGLDMTCNFRKCRKPLSTVAWVTICSHAFCAEHGESEFGKKVQDVLLCPACNSQLTEKYDVVQADLSPPETLKSMIMAGMRPDIIMDIAMRAMTFWSYQLEEEAKYHENVARHAREKATSLEHFYNLNLQRLKVDLQNDRKKIENLQLECLKQKQLAEEYIIILEEKNRKIQNLQYELGTQKRNTVHLYETEEVENKGRQNDANITMNRFKPQELTTKFIFQPQMAKQRIYENQKFGKKEPLEKNDDNFVFNPILY